MEFPKTKTLSKLRTLTKLNDHGKINYPIFLWVLFGAAFAVEVAAFAFEAAGLSAFGAAFFVSVFSILAGFSSAPSAAVSSAFTKLSGVMYPALLKMLYHCANFLMSETYTLSVS